MPNIRGLGQEQIFNRGHQIVDIIVYHYVHVSALQSLREPLDAFLKRRGGTKQSPEIATPPLRIPKRIREVAMTKVGA